MDIHHLVKMANQIGQFFEAEPDQEQAAKDVVSHIKRFWDPRMRKALVAHAEQRGAGLSGFVTQAILAQKQLL